MMSQSKVAQSSRGGGKVPNFPRGFNIKAVLERSNKAAAYLTSGERPPGLKELAVTKESTPQEVPYLHLAVDCSDEAKQAVLVAALLMMKVHSNDISVYSGYFTYLDSICDGFLSGSGLEALTGGNIIPKPITVFSTEDIFSCMLFDHDEVEKDIRELWAIKKDVQTKDENIVIELQPGGYKTCRPDFNSKFRYAIGGVLACLITKRLSDVNYNQWMQIRWRAFKATAGVTVDEEDMDVGLFPPVQSCIQIHSLMSSHFKFRKHVFMLMATIASLTTRWAAVMKVVMKLAKGTEMTHFYLINEYIVQANPALLCYKPLQSQMRKFASALLDISQYGPGTMPYLKILHEGPAVEPLNRNNFNLLIAIAKQIGMKMQPNLQNYLGGETGGEERAGEIITEAVKFAEAHNGMEGVDDMADSLLQESSVLNSIVQGMADGGDLDGLKET